MLADDLHTFVGTMRVILNVRSETDAALAMDQLALACEELLDENDGDKVMVTQITENTGDITPEETIILLKRARNALIRTRFKDCYTLGQSLDRVVHGLEIRAGGKDVKPQYDYAAFSDVADSVLNERGDPL